MRIAVVGLGFMGSTHLQAIENVASIQLAAVVSDDPVKLSGDLTKIQGNLDRGAGKVDFSEVHKYRAIEEALADPDVDAVDLCLPTHLHEPAAIQALEAGKHVLVEKPMALDGDACDRMMEAAAKADRILMAAQVLRFWPDYQPLIDHQHNGRLGAMRAAMFRRRCAAPSWGKWLKDPEKGGGGVFDLLIHDVDMAIHLFGSPASVSATGVEDLSAGIDIVTAQLHYDKVDSVVITGGWHHPSAYPFSMEYTASFDRGTIEYSSAGRPVKLYNASGDEVSPKLSERDGFEAELEYFARCVDSGTQPERCPPGESAAAVRLMRLIGEARKSKGDKIPFAN